MSLTLCDGNGDEWEYQVVGVGMRDAVAPGGTTVGEEFVSIVCWQSRAEMIGFRHITAPVGVDLKCPDVQRRLLTSSDSEGHRPLPRR